MTWQPPVWRTTGTSSPSTSARPSSVHLFCLHHAGGTTASFAAWGFSGVDVTKLGYRGRDFTSVAAAADVLARRMEASPSPGLAIYGHSMGAVLAFEISLRLQDTGRVKHVFLAAARPPVGTPDGGAAALPAGASPHAATLAGVDASSGAMSERAREVLLEDLELLATYRGRPASGQLKVPATILYSDNDPVVPAIDSVRWASWCSEEPRLVLVPGGGHLFHRNKPEVLELVERTLSPVPQVGPALPGTASA